MLIKIRALILYVPFIVTFIFCATVYLLLLFIFEPKKSTWFRQIFGLAMIKAAANKLVVLSLPPQNNKAYLYVPNHQSMFDAFILAQAIPTHVLAVAKKEAFQIPIFGSIIKRLGLVSINRENHDQAMRGIDLAAEKITAGNSMIVFAEGTRTRDGQVGAFKNGAFKLAFDAKASIVPVGIIGSYDSQPAGSWVIKPGVFKINFGQPIHYYEYKHLSIPDLADLVRNQVIDLSNNSL